MGGEAEAAMYVFLATFLWKSSDSLGPKLRDVNYQIQVYQLAPVVCGSLGHSNASAKRGARCVRWVMCDFSNVILWRMSLIDFFMFRSQKLKPSQPPVEAHSIQGPNTKDRRRRKPRALESCLFTVKKHGRLAIWRRMASVVTNLFYPFCFCVFFLFIPWNVLSKILLLVLTYFSVTKWQKFRFARA